MDPIVDPFEPLPDVSGATTTAGDLYQQLLDLVMGGGPVMMLLGVASVVGVSVVIIKLLQFALSSLWSRGTVEKALTNWQQGRTQEAMSLAKKARHPAGVVLLTAMEGFWHFGAQDQTVREEVERIAQRELSRHSRYLSVLDIISQLAPLMGLLGTIFGMIAAFQALQSAGSHADPAVLAGGIWEALLTTAAGLSVAIPMTIFYYLLDGHVQSTRQFMEDTVTRVFTRSNTVAQVVPLHSAANHNSSHNSAYAPAVKQATEASGSYALS